MKRRLIWFGLALVALPAWAQTGQQRDWCNSPAVTNDQRIEGCSALIQSLREAGANQAATYNNRGTAYRGNGLYGLAIADYSEAIAIKPDFSDAWNNRGLTHEMMGDDDAAIADYTKVIVLKPDDAAAYASRAAADEHKGLGEQAIADYRAALKLDPKQDLAKQSLKRLGAVSTEKCPFTYTDSVRDEVIVPALKKWDAARELSKQPLETYFDLSHPGPNYRNGHTFAQTDGNAILVFQESAITLDGDELVVVYDPCERSVVYMEERSSLIVVGYLAPKENSDQAVKSGLVGSWIVPGHYWLAAADDTDNAPASVMRVVQSFRANGTGTARLYKDSACTVADKSAAFTWTIRNHVLTVAAANGKRDEDALIIGPQTPEVAGIDPGADPKVIVFTSQDHKFEGRFVKASTCGWPANGARYTG